VLKLTSRFQISIWRDNDMGRKSPEARGAERFRAGGSPAKVPRGFSQEAAEIWRGIVNGKPVDWFDKSSLQLLGLYCRALVLADKLSASLDNANSLLAGDAPEREVRLVKLTGSITTMASKLRLTPQASIDRKSGMTTETGDGAEDDNALLGGDPAWSTVREQIREKATRELSEGDLLGTGDAWKKRH
jgi:phage terminase small subunit